MKTNKSFDDGGAVDPPTLRPARIKLGTRVAARFADAGLEEPLFEVHLGVGTPDLVVPIYCYEATKLYEGGT
jgi:hypothetical protein